MDQLQTSNWERTKFIFAACFVLFACISMQLSCSPKPPVAAPAAIKSDDVPPPPEDSSKQQSSPDTDQPQETNATGNRLLFTPKADPGPQPLVQNGPPVVIAGHLPPSGTLQNKLSGRIGDVLSLQLDDCQNITHVKWKVKPRPDHFEVGPVLHKVNDTTYVVDGPPDRKVTFGSTTEGKYDITVEFSGPGGIDDRECEIEYGTLVDGNVLAPAGENMDAQDHPTFENAVVQAFRACDDPSKGSNRYKFADAIDDVIALAQGPNPNITRTDEIPGALRDALRKRLKSDFVYWGKFILKLQNALSDALDSGQLDDAGAVGDKKLKGYLQLLGATAETLKTK